MDAAKKPAARLSREDMRFVKFIGKCASNQLRTMDDESAHNVLECYVDWYRSIEKRGLTNLPAVTNRKEVAHTQQLSAEEGRWLREVDAWWASLRPTERMWIFGRFEGYMERSR